MMTDRKVPIPKQFKILAHQIIVKYEQKECDLQTLQGAANFNYNRITLLDHEALGHPRTHTETTFVEETLHHIGRILDIDWLKGLDDDENHKQVGRLAEALVQVFHTAEF